MKTHALALFFSVLFPSMLLRGQQYQWETLAGNDGGPGIADGAGPSARFQYPKGVALDAGGNAYVADSSNFTIRKITPTGVVTTMAGSPGVSAYTNGTGTAARFKNPSRVAVDANGNVFVSDYHTIRMVAADGEVITLAGNAGVPGSADGTGSDARFNSPAGLALDGKGNLYIADSSNSVIRKMVISTGVVSTFVGSAGVRGSADGTGSNALFKWASGVAIDGTGILYVADTSNNTIRKVTEAGVVTTLAGSVGLSGSYDGTGSNARFYQPSSVSATSDGTVYVGDTWNHTIRKVTSDGVVSTLAGQAGTSTIGVDATGANARFGSVYDTAIDSSGALLVADYDNHAIRKVSPFGVVTTLAGKWRSRGSADGTGTAATFDNPTGVAVDASHTVYVADLANYKVRKVSTTGVVSTWATGFSGLNGVAIDNTTGNAYVADSGNNRICKITSTGVVSTLASGFNGPRGVVVATGGILYVTDYSNHRICKVTSTGVVTTVAGSAGVLGSSDGTGSDARFNYPFGIGIDIAGNLYVSDWGNHTIRKVTGAGVVTTLAGGASLSGSTDGSGNVARFNHPCGLAVDNSGNLIVADHDNHAIRKVTSGGVVNTIGGPSTVGTIGDGPISTARFNFPSGVAIGSNGVIYVADSSNNRIVKGTPLSPEVAIEQPAGVDLTNGDEFGFGMVTLSEALAKTFTIRNTGSLSHITSVSTVGTHMDDFRVDISGMLTSIPAGEQTTFQVSFTPGAAGGRAATLRIVNEDADEATFVLALNGNGNTPPTFAGYSISTSYLTAATVSIRKLLAKAFDPEGEAVTVSGAGPASAQSGTVVLLETGIRYTPPAGFTGTDTFPVTLSDAGGAATSGMVMVTVGPAATAGGTTVNTPIITVLPGGHIGLKFHGIPGRNYQIQRSTDMSAWTTITIVTANATGAMTFTDETPPQTSAFYRLALP